MEIRQETVFNAIRYLQSREGLLTAGLIIMRSRQLVALIIEKTSKRA